MTLSNINKRDYVRIRFNGRHVKSGTRARVIETWAASPYPLDWVIRNAANYGLEPDPERFINAPWVMVLPHGLSRAALYLPADGCELIEPFDFKNRVSHYYF